MRSDAAHALIGDVDIVETAHAAAFFLGDGVIVTAALVRAFTKLPAR